MGMDQQIEEILERLWTLAEEINGSDLAYFADRHEDAGQTT